MSQRTRIGLVVTGIYLIFIGLMYCWSEQSISTLELNAFGDYLAGVFGPIAFLWLVLGYSQQGEELQLNTEALRLQHEELMNSVAEQRLLVAEQQAQTGLARQQLAEERRRSAKADKDREREAQPYFYIFGALQHTLVSHTVWTIHVNCHIKACADLEAEFTGIQIAEVFDIEALEPQKHFNHSVCTTKNVQNEEFVLRYRDITGKRKAKIFKVSETRGGAELSFLEEEADDEDE